MIYSDFEWIKILLDMCFVIDDPIVCQIASYYKWNYNRIYSILHNFRYHLRKCEYNNVSFPKIIKIAVIEAAVDADQDTDRDIAGTHSLEMAQNKFLNLGWAIFQMTV